MDYISLIKRAKNKEKEAFSLLYNEFYTPIYRFVLSRTKDEDKTLDICQEVFIKWYESLDKYEVKIEPKSYLLLIANRIIINESKKKKAAYIEEEEYDFIKDENVSIEEDLDFEMEIDKIKILFEELTESEKNVLTLRYISDFDTKTIAEALEKSESNIRQIESRGLKKLKKLYQEKYAKN